MEKSYYLDKIFFLNSNIGWIAAETRSELGGDQKTDVLFKTTNGGVKWELAYSQDNNKAFGLQDVAFVDENNGIAVGQFGKILRTTDGGESWVQDSFDPKQGATLPPTMTIGYLGTKPLIGTFSSGIYAMPETINTVDESANTDAITAYPNPFRDYINFKINRTIISPEVEIEIWDFAGCLVGSEVLNTSGNGVIRFRPETNTAGAYIYNISVDGQTFTGIVVRE